MWYILEQYFIELENYEKHTLSIYKRRDILAQLLAEDKYKCIFSDEMLELEFYFRPNQYKKITEHLFFEYNERCENYIIETYPEYGKKGH